jgi:hypothetical protein
MRCFRVFDSVLLAAIVPLVAAFLLPQPVSVQRTQATSRSTRERNGHVLFADTTGISSPDPSFDRSVEGFDLNVALFCGGLAFDSYQEPPANSSRWERGSNGMDVAFVSQAFTNNFYQGLVEITPLSCQGLPDEDDGLESLMTGGGVDACVMVAAVEGKWEEDIELLNQEYHEGILDLSGATHIGKSSTAWANVDEKKSMREKKKSGKQPPYHVRKSWGKDASAVWPEPSPFYLYIQKPSEARLLFSLCDDNVMSQPKPLYSTHVPLSKLLPQVRYSQDEIVTKLKNEIIEKIKRGEIDADKIDEEVSKAVNADAQAWEGDLKMTSKPRIKNKNSQLALAVAAGAMVAGPAGAAVGAALGSMYEGQVKGRIKLRLRYLPIPKTDSRRDHYVVTGGMPGIDWGSLYEKYMSKELGFADTALVPAQNPGGNDLEHCFVINHSKTGGCCALYRSLEKKLIVISFRGTCAPIDLVTDASIVQETWVEGEDAKDPATAKVHIGFRRSLDSISRRLKELMLAAVRPGESISEYDVIVTGHSLGGALATLFTADIGEFGIDAGRTLPTIDASDDWWKALANRFTGNVDQQQPSAQPPRPRSLRVYNFGSPRAGNKAFSQRFEQLLKDGSIDQAYRIVNGKDVVARMPRTMGALSVDYDHCGSTVLVQTPTQENPDKVLWIEGESDNTDCPVRDYEKMMSSPTAEGTLLGDVLKVIRNDKDGSGLVDEQDQKLLSQVGNIASKVQERLSTVTASDITSLLGFDKSFTDRELQMVQALFKGEALAHHLEDSYYSAMGSCTGFVALLGEDIVPVNEQTVALLSSETEQNELSALEDLAVEGATS